VLDEFLERAGLVERQLQLLRDGLVVPVVHFAIVLMEALHSFSPYSE
jgi:fumarate reductase subunit C